MAAKILLASRQIESFPIEERTGIREYGGFFVEIVPQSVAALNRPCEIIVAINQNLTIINNKGVISYDDLVNMCDWAEEQVWQ